MTTWRPDDGRGPSQKVLELIVGYMERVARPAYMGIISLEIHWSLARTQEAMDRLEDAGLVRQLTLDEKRGRGLPDVANLYVLIDGHGRE